MHTVRQTRACTLAVRPDHVHWLQNQTMHIAWLPDQRMHIGFHTRACTLASRPEHAHWLPDQSMHTDCQTRARNCGQTDQSTDAGYQNRASTRNTEPKYERWLPEKSTHKGYHSQKIINHGAWNTGSIVHCLSSLDNFGQETKKMLWKSGYLV
jgi:hypothetical protein